MLERPRGGEVDARAPEGTDRSVLLSISHLEVRYGAALAISDMSLDVTEGSVLAVLGANGAGKTSLARACAGLVPAAGGIIRFGGEEITHWSADRRRRAGLVYLPEGRGIFPSLTVGENLRIAVRLAPSRAAAVERAFTLFPALAQRRGQQAGSLSGGEQQMLSLARAFAVEPRLVVVDEPSLGLAPMLVDMVFETLGQAKQSGLTLIVIEQFAHKALAIADRCVILRRREISWQGTGSEARTQLSAHYFGGSDPAVDGVKSGRAGSA
jgi:branched-chain amino acid transport system ATP-binding protein